MARKIRRASVRWRPRSGISRRYRSRPFHMRISRREFVSAAASCSAHLALVAIATQAGARALWAQPRGVVGAREPFGNLQVVGDGGWALVSTPLGGDRATLSNCGLIAGRSRVVATYG